MWAILSRNRDAGLLVLRILLGTYFIWAHGWTNLAGGIERWKELGGAMKHFGVNFWPAYWGFVATMAETLGMVFFIVGFVFRPACLIIALTMVVAGLQFLNSKGGLFAAHHPWELAIVFFSLIFVGPGKYSADKA